jgi:gamma-glutamyltranspeptidase/glutathione hydrolase
MYPGALTLEYRIPPSVRDALARKGHKVKVTGSWSLGLNAAILLDPETNVLSAGADPRCDAYALAW